MIWFVLAPGPSMTKEIAESVRGHNVCAVGNVFQLAPWADLLVANDKSWWAKHPEAKEVEGRKFSGWKFEGRFRFEGLEYVSPCTYGTGSNSGVLSLDLVRNLGAKTVVMLGFDMHGTHFFGPYTNGCANTPERRRREHLAQFDNWAYQNKQVRVVNCTEGSKIKAFERGVLGDFIGGL